MLTRSTNNNAETIIMFANICFAFFPTMSLQVSSPGFPPGFPRFPLVSLVSLGFPPGFPGSSWVPWVPWPGWPGWVPLHCTDCTVHCTVVQNCKRSPTFYVLQVYLCSCCALYSKKDSLSYKPRIKRWFLRKSLR